MHRFKYKHFVRKYKYVAIFMPIQVTIIHENPYMSYTLEQFPHRNWYKY